VPSPLRETAPSTWPLEAQSARYKLERHRPLIAGEASELLYWAAEDSVSAASIVTLTERTACMVPQDVRGYDLEDGRSLLIELASGGHSLVVLSGRTIIRVDAAHEVEIHIHDSAMVAIIVGSSKRASVHAHEEATVYVAAEGGACGVLRIEDTASFGTVIESTEFTKADVWKWEL
jgi:hypothetical protein